MTKKVSIRRLASGVPGFDMILGGGLPEFSFNLIAGSPGVGKTTLGHQLMFALANQDRKAIYFTVLGEPPLKMLRYQQQFTFFDADKVNDSIRFVNLAAEALNGDPQKILARIMHEVETDSPGLVFVDSFRSIVKSTGSQHLEAALQQFIQELGMQLTACQATTFLIGEFQTHEGEGNPVFTVADGVIWLMRDMHEGSMVRKLEIKKMRGQAPLPGLHTFRINDEGIQAFPRTIIACPASGKHATRKQRAAKRLSLGVAGLDKMLGGGLPEGYSMLIAGPSGSGKTVLATSFLAEGMRHGEGAIIAAFEERPGGVLNSELESLMRSGKLGVISTRSLDLTIDETLHDMTGMVRRLKAKRVVIDSLSGYELALAPTFRRDFRESLYRMIATLTDLGTTVLVTSELEDRYIDLRFSPYGAAFLTDAIIVQRYIETGSELKRVLAVVKLRGSAHSNELRQFTINSKGIVVGAVLTGYDGLLSGRTTLSAVEETTGDGRSRKKR